MTNRYKRHVASKIPTPCAWRRLVEWFGGRSVYRMHFVTGLLWISITTRLSQRTVHWNIRRNIVSFESKVHVMRLFVMSLVVHLDELHDVNYDAADTPPGSLAMSLGSRICISWLFRIIITVIPEWRSICTRTNPFTWSYFPCLLGRFPYHLCQQLVVRPVC